MDTARAQRFHKDDEVIGIYYLALLRQVISRHGGELKGFDADISTLNDNRKRISLRTLYRCSVLSLPEQKAGLGLEYGRQLSLVAADCVGQVLMSSDTLKDVLSALQRYHHLMALCLAIEPIIKNNTSSIGFHEVCHEHTPLKLRWFLSEALYASILQQASWLTGSPLQFEELDFPFDEPAHAHLYETAFKCRLNFNASHHRIVFATHYLDMPVLSANPTLRAIKLKQCERALHACQRRLPVKERVKKILATAHPQYPCLEDLALQLNISRSCLYRRLQEENTSYQCLINEFKREQSISLLQQSPLTVSEIAEELGFSDASSFRRAFKNWTGKQPSTLRRLSH
ncbi:MAG: AraC family transcriptional regulator ligand-binding domain-containing protein [Oleiphilaceae bacterium]|nr:AraC family transcriptional regulator ligand-binding domain-containing protein [Oleiphilaceae bacterium]